MIECGIVARVKENKATIHFDRRGKCDNCHLCKPTKDGMKVEIVVDNTLDVNVDDVVQVDMGKSSLKIASVMLYLIPLLLTGIMIGVGYVIGRLAMILLPILALTIGLVVAILIDKLAIRKNKGFCPNLIKVISHGDNDNFNKK